MVRKMTRRMLNRSRRRRVQRDPRLTLRKSLRTNHTAKQLGGFRYGNKSKHTPIPGEILISSPKSVNRTARTRTRSKTRSKTRKQFKWF